MRRASAIVVLELILQSAPARAADIDTVRANLVGFFTGQGGNPADPDVAAALKSLQASASAAQSSLTAQGSWPDLNYAEVPSGSWSPSTHYVRLLTMARAYTTPGQSLQGSLALKTAIEKALGFIQGIVHDGCARPGNWWYWRIGIPMQLGPTLLLLQGKISAALFDAALKTLSYLITPSPSGTGANLCWEATNHLYYAALAGDAARLAVVKAAMDSLAVVSTTEEGVMPDLSFHQHGAQLYTGGYGAAYAHDMARYLRFAEGSSAQLSASGVALLESYIAEGVRWSLFHNYFDASVVGREITRPGKNGGGGLYALLLLASRPGPRQVELTAAARKMLESWSATFPTEMAPVAAAVRKAATPAAWPAGHHHYPSSDYAIHRRPSYFASLKMLSSRMVAAELVNNEGKKSWHLSDGFLYLVLSGKEYFGGDIWPTLDWSRLPGTTVERKPRTPGQGYGKGSRSFVGGVTDGVLGVAAMDFAANESALTAKKSWFFFDTEIVSLASEITCASSNQVETTVAQWPLSTPDAAVVVDGSPKPASAPWKEELKNPRWVHADGVGYFFLASPGLWAQRQQQSGAWSDLGIGPTAVKQSTVLTLWMAHGAAPSAAGYGFVLLPGKTAAEVQGWAAAPPVEVLARTASIHAVKQHQLGAVGAVFWKAGSVDKVTASAPCALLYTASGNRFSLAASDPGHGSTKLVLEIDEPLTPVQLEAGMTSARSGGKTTVSLSLAGGRTVQGTFTRDMVPPAGEPAQPEAGPAGDPVKRSEAGAGSDGPAGPAPSGEGCCSVASAEGPGPWATLAAAAVLAARLGGRRRQSLRGTRDRRSGT